MADKVTRSLSANLMMILSILVVCVVVPLGFISAESFSRWLSSRGIHASPNLVGGYPVAEVSGFDRRLKDPPAGADKAQIERALALNRFSIRRVKFNRWSGIGIAPRLNLSFEFEGQLPDPQNSAKKFSMTVIHVYMRAPGREIGSLASGRVADAEFVGPAWNYQVVIDGFHDQARIFNRKGDLVALGLGLYVDHELASAREQRAGQGNKVAKTRITAALPMDFLGDPAEGIWQYYVLVGLSDLRHPSMMLHSAGNAGPSAYCGALAKDPSSTTGGRPGLRPLAVTNPI